MKLYDVGSLPIDEKAETLDLGARTYISLLPSLTLSDNRAVAASRIFEQRSLRIFLDKIEAGLDIPNYPQLRDMNAMFLDTLNGIVKRESGYRRTGRIGLRQAARIPEVEVIRRNSSALREKSGVEKIELKVCVTGPYTLAAVFDSRDPSMFRELGEALAKLLSDALFKKKDAEVSLVAIDEPVFGLVSDPLLDYGSEGREALLDSWERICYTALSRGVETAFHLHNTSDDLFWSVKSLRIVESHVGDPLYTSDHTRKMLEERDKFLKASICITIFDQLIVQWLQQKGIEEGKEGSQDALAQAWKSIQSGALDPTSLLETSELMLKRLKDTTGRFGVVRVPYAGPECGLRSFPNYDSAIKCLSRVSKAIKDFKRESKTLARNS